MQSKECIERDWMLQILQATVATCQVIGATGTWRISVRWSATKHQSIFPIFFLFRPWGGYEMLKCGMEMYKTKTPWPTGGWTNLNSEECTEIIESHRCHETPPEQMWKHDALAVMQTSSRRWPVSSEKWSAVCTAAWEQLGLAAVATVASLGSLSSITDHRNRADGADGAGGFAGRLTSFGSRRCRRCLLHVLKHCRAAPSLRAVLGCDVRHGWATATAVPRLSGWG